MTSDHPMTMKNEIESGFDKDNQLSVDRKLGKSKAHVDKRNQGRTILTI